MKKIVMIVLTVFLINHNFYVYASSDMENQFYLLQHHALKSEKKYDKVVEILNAIGIVSGDGSGDFKLQDELKREDAILLICRLMNVSPEVITKANMVNSSFKDLSAGKYYVPYVKYAEQKLWVRGISSETFGVGRTVTKKEFLAIILRILEYEANWEKRDIIKLSSELGLIVNIDIDQPDKPIKRLDSFLVMYNTLFSTPNKSEFEFYKKVGIQFPKEIDSFMVKSILSKNLREVEIEFNKPVSTFLKEAKFSVKNANLGRISARISDDYSKLILFFGINMQNGALYQIEIDGIYSQKASKLPKTMISFISYDLKVPEIVSVKQIENELIEVIFDEPVSNYGNVTIRKYYKEKDDKPLILGLKNFVLKEFGNKLYIKGLKYEYDTLYIMDFMGYMDYLGNRGINLEKEIIFKKSHEK